MRANGPTLIWLSYPLGISDPRPPAIPAPELSDLYTIGKDGANVQILRLANHTGTHLDSPRHVIANGLTIHDFEPAEFSFHAPVVIDLPLHDATIVAITHLKPFASRLATADIALFRFGYGHVRKDAPERFSRQCPGFGVESGRWLRLSAPNLRAIGMDVPSVACIAHLEETMAVHHELLGGDRRFLILEDMNLDHDLAQLAEVQVCPWLVVGMDSGPCSILGVLKT